MLLTVAASTFALSAGAQVPAPPTTAFDGVYFGSRTFEQAYEGKSWVRFCLTSGTLAPLTIVNGMARTLWAGTAEGYVSPQGAIVMHAPDSIRFEGQIDSQGTVRGRFTGECSYQLVWQKAPESTTAFDGEYGGVSRESSKAASGPSTECPANGIPVTLTIWKGVVRSDRGSWQGTVSPQGALVMQNREQPFAAG
jgi:hypothetical protein